MFDGFFLKPFHVRFIMTVRQFTSLKEVPTDLQEPEAHKVGAQGNSGVNEPGRPLEVRGGRTLRDVAGRYAQQVVQGVVQPVLPDEGGAQGADDAGEDGAAD